MSTEPVTVVGAGPAGLACAIALARAGLAVEVRERRASVGGRFHGDFQGLENWSDRDDILDELKAAGIAASFDHHPVSRSTVFDGWGEAHEVRGERPFYYLVRRGGGAGTLDTALLEQARAAGARVRFDDPVGSVEGPAVLAIGPRRADAIAAGYVFDTDAEDGSWAAFDDRLAPHGYAYLLIHAGRGTVASCMFTGFKNEASHLARTVAFFERRAGLVMRNPRPFGGYANFRLPRTAMQGGHPVIGEQAGFQDALAGFGMRYAIRSGVLAARSIVEGADYTALWRAELLPGLRTGVANRYIFNAIGRRGRRWALRGLAAGQTSGRLQRLYRPSPLTRIVYPLARWRYRQPLADLSCNHAECRCVWCTHGGEPAATSCL
jgi:flavin-dependent dehydrogenase